MTQTTSSPWTLAPGEHVCWRADTLREFTAGREALAAQASRCAGGLLVLDGASVGATDPSAAQPSSAGGSGGGQDFGSKLLAVRERMRQWDGDGAVPWVLASMEQLSVPDAPVAEVVALELELAELAAATNTAVVCAYQASLWQPAVLRDIVAVHSRIVGIDAGSAGFRLRLLGGHTYVLEGSVGFESLRAFATALRGALIRTPHLRLGCERLELIEAAAWRVLVETVAGTPDASVLLEGVNETVQGAWLLSGYGAAGIAVQVQP